jgi:hypothetical protein
MKESRCATTGLSSCSPTLPARPSGTIGTATPVRGTWTREWLRLAGLLTEDGTLDRRGTGRTKHTQEVEVAELNDREKSVVAAYEDLERAMRTGERHRDEQQLANFRQRAEYARHNAEAREQLQAQRQAEIDALAAATQAKRDAQALAAQEAYKRTARATFPGTQAQFDAVWPDLLKAWQIRNTADDQSALIEQKRRQLGNII